MNTAIIAAAGRGTRFNSNRPKQFLKLLGKPLILHTLEAFERCSAVQEIVLVLAADEINDFAAIAESAGISKLKKIVGGGASRAESVRNGLEAVDPSAEIVTVHDGARPLVSVDEIERTIEKATETGVACLVTAVTDTIKTIDGGFITGTVDRTKLRRALTPQAFQYDILRRILSQVKLDDSVTDECYMAEKMGIEVAIVEGSPRNIKMTHIDDLKVAELFLRNDV